MKGKGTARQKKAFELFTSYMERYDRMGINPPPMGEILVQAGYSPSIRKQPSAVTSSEAWKGYLEKVDDTAILDKWKEWALDDDPKNRNVALKAGENIMKLKDRYPAHKGKVAHLHADISDLFEENENIHS